MFTKLFGSGKPAAPRDNSEQIAATVQKIQGVVELLEKKTEHLQKKIDKELIAAKAHAAKNKPLAIQHLKRKKRLDKQKQQIDGQIDTLYAQVDAIESMAMSRQVIEASQATHRVMKESMQDADKVQDTLEDLNEQMTQFNEITSMLANSEIQGVYDEDELLKELEDLDQEDLDSQLQDLDAELPDVPATAVPQPAAREPVKPKAQHDLDDLAEWAS